MLSVSKFVSLAPRNLIAVASGYADRDP